MFTAKRSVIVNCSTVIYLSHSFVNSNQSYRTGSDLKYTYLSSVLARDVNDKFCLVEHLSYRNRRLFYCYQFVCGTYGMKKNN